MSVRSRCLAALLALFAAAGCATAPREPSAAASAPAPEAGKDSPTDEVAEFKAIVAAFQGERWEEVITRSLPCLKASTSRRDQWRVLAMTARATFGLRRWEDSARLSRMGLDLAAESSIIDATPEWIRGLVIVEAESLLHVDRAAEAGQRLDEAAAHVPELRRDGLWRAFRLAARPGDGVLFDMPAVDPADEGALDDGRRRIERVMAAAMEHIRRRLGVPELAFPPIRVIAVDRELEDGDPLMSANVVARGSGWIGVIRIRIETVLHPTPQEEQRLAHELAHVLHLEGTGAAARESPPWLLEGIAHWVETADDLEHREMVLGRATRSADSPETSVGAHLESEAALAAAADDETQRVCGAVVFFQLERMLGRTAVQRLVLRLLKEGDWAAVLREETRLDMPRLLERVRSGYLEWATATFPEREELLEVARLEREGKFREAVQAVNAYLTRTADGPTRWLAEVGRLRLLVKLEDWPAARAALAPIHALRRSRPRAFTVPQGVMSEVAVLRGIEDWAGVAALTREARESLWVLNREWRVELDAALAEAEKRLAEAAPPK